MLKFKLISSKVMVDPDAPSPSKPEYREYLHWWAYYICYSSTVLSCIFPKLWIAPPLRKKQMNAAWQLAHYFYVCSSRTPYLDNLQDWMQPSQKRRGVFLFHPSTSEELLLCMLLGKKAQFLR